MGLKFIKIGKARFNANNIDLISDVGVFRHPDGHGGGGKYGVAFQFTASGTEYYVRSSFSRESHAYLEPRIMSLSTEPLDMVEKDLETLKGLCVAVHDSFMDFLTLDSHVGVFDITDNIRIHSEGLKFRNEIQKPMEVTSDNRLL